MRVLDARKTTVHEELRIVDHDSFQRIFYGETLIADSGPESFQRAAEWALAAAPLKGKTVAWIGGGFCIGPRLFTIADCQQTVYEIEPTLAEFCPKGITFVVGDYQDTLKGQFDVIVYDWNWDIPYDHLSKHLNPGGVILPKKE